MARADQSRVLQSVTKGLALIVSVGVNGAVSVKSSQASPVRAESIQLEKTKLQFAELKLVKKRLVTPKGSVLRVAVEDRRNLQRAKSIQVPAKTRSIGTRR